jgi:16S rRNA processing protein RimM
LTNSDEKKGGGKGDETLVAVGRIVAAHGLRGELKVFPLTDSPERLPRMRSVFVYGEEPGASESFEIESVRTGGDHVLVKLRGVDGRNAAESMRGRWLGIPQSERRSPPDNAFYPDQLIGLRAETADGVPIGTVTGVLPYPAQALLSVDRNGSEVLIPMVKEIIKKVDIPSGIVVIDSIEGLF